MPIKKLTDPLIMLWILLRDISIVIFEVVRCYYYYDKDERRTGALKKVRYDIIPTYEVQVMPIKKETKEMIEKRIKTRKILIEVHTEEIERLEKLLIENPKQFLIDAQAAGKRIAIFDCNDKWVVSDELDFNCAIDRYKIIEDEFYVVDDEIFGEQRITRYMKCGLTGNVTMEFVTC